MSRCWPRRVFTCAMVLLALLPLIALSKGNVQSVLIFTIYVAVWLLNPWLGFLRRMPLPLYVNYMLLAFLVSAATEYFVFVQHFEVFDESLMRDLILGAGIYLPLAALWLLLLKRYAFRLRDVYGVSGLVGIVLEQNGRILLSFNPLAYFYIFIVYGAILALPYLVLEPCFYSSREPVKGKERTKAFLTLLLAYPIGFLWIVMLKQVWG